MATSWHGFDKPEQLSVNKGNTNNDTDFILQPPLRPTIYHNAQQVQKFSHPKNTQLRQMPQLKE